MAAVRLKSACGREPIALIDLKPQRHPYATADSRNRQQDRLRNDPHYSIRYHRPEHSQAEIHPASETTTPGIGANRQTAEIEPLSQVG